VALAAFAALLLMVDLVTPGPMSYFELSFMSAGGAALALAAMGQTVVVLTGGFDLSAGAVVSLVNVVLGSYMGPGVSSQVLFGVAALAIGGAVGAVNGFFVAFARLQPIVVTLSTMFIVQGVTLLIMDTPGGMIPPEFSAFLVGDAIPGVLPAPVVVVALALLAWLLVKNTRLGVGLYAVGSDEDAARAAGVPIRAVEFAAYVLAGAFYGAAGAFVSAQTGSADPLVGRPMLLQIFTAVVLGGTLLGGGRGGCVGSVVGAYTLIIVVNILLVLNVSAYYSSVAEGVILIPAVLGASLGRRSPIADYLRLARLKLRARADGTLPRARRGGGIQEFSLLARARGRAAVVDPGWLARHRGMLRHVLPAYLGFVLILAATHLVHGNTLTNPGYFNSLVVLSSFLIILALGQGAAILTGGLDLSVPWMIGLVGILVAGLVRGSDEVALWAISSAPGWAPSTAPGSCCWACRRS
jgi:ribose transport system permease protein